MSSRELWKFTFPRKRNLGGRCIYITKEILSRWGKMFCLCWGLTSQSAIFQSCRDGATASWVINQYFWGVKCLAQGHNTAAVGFEPPTSRSGVRHSTTEPPRSDVSDFARDRYFNGYSENRSVQENFDLITSFIQESADKHIPSKTSRSVSSVPWITPEIRRKIRRRNKTHAKAKKTGSSKLRSKFETLRREIKADVKKQHDLYVNNLVGDIKANPRDFYRYINGQKKDTQGIPPLKRRNGKGVAESELEQADEFNGQFTDVFNKNEHSQVPLPNRSAPFMNDIVVSAVGVTKLLKVLNPSKALGPDELHPRVLKELASKLGPVFPHLFQQSIDTGEIPKEWCLANICPLFKKGDRSLACNYRPVSLTCVPCKLLEHIVCSNIMAHLDEHKLLSDRQHAFRKRHNCETQLITVIND